jgi:hypothetical protein
VRNNIFFVALFGDPNLYLPEGEGEAVIQQLQKQTIQRQVQPHFDSPDYRAAPDQTITFSAENSQVYNDEIVEYKWSFPLGEGGSEYRTTQPSVQHTYTEPFEGDVYLTVVTASGLEKDVTAHVTIIDPATLPAAPSAPRNLQLELTDENSVHFSWEATDDLADQWLLSVNDVLLGYTEKDQTSIEIGDLRMNETTLFSVQAVSSNDTASEVVSVSLSPKRQSVLASGVADESVKSTDTTSVFGVATSQTGSPFNPLFGVINPIADLPRVTTGNGGSNQPVDLLNIGVAVLGILSVGGIVLAERWRRMTRTVQRKQ